MITLKELGSVSHEIEKALTTLKEEYQDQYQK